MLMQDFKEAIYSLLPVVILVFILHFFVNILNVDITLRFLAGTLFSLIGLFLFFLGIKHCLAPLGSMMGSRFPFAPNIVIMLLMVFFIGLSANIADPSVMVLSKHIQSISSGDAPSSMIVILCVVLGVGLFLSLGLVGVAFKVSPAITCGLGYSLALLISFFAPPEFLALAFDSGGVATGPLTVPFLLAISMSFVSVLAKHTNADGFGVLGLVALGPIISVMLLGIFW